jgi:hypothetical protein
MQTAWKILKILFVMVISVPLALLGTFALFIVLAFAYGLLTALLRLEPLSESVTGTGATVMFFGFLYVIYELLTRALMARAVPQSATAFASPRPSPPIGRTVLKAMSLVAAIWTGVFLLLWLPLATINKHQVDKRSTTVATVTDHRAHDVDRFGRPRKSVQATLSFQRTDARGWVEDCRLENFQLGGPKDGSSWATTLQLAVHPYSCNEPVVLSHRPTWSAQFGAFIVIMLVLMAATAVLVFGTLCTERQERFQPSS